jgi:DNA polymerase elongation subunit (family B)
MNVVLNIILKEGDVKKAIAFVQGEVNNINGGTVDLNKLTVTKSITKGVDRYEGILPHIELAKKLRDRNPSEPPTAGSRISYIIIRGNQMLSKRAEDPDYIRDRGLKIDSVYYVENQLIPPLERIFSVIGVDKGELMGKGRQCNLKNLLNPMDRNHKIETPPEKTVIDSLEGFLCRECKRNFRRVPLLGRCECGGEIFAFGNGNLGGLVKAVN